MSRSHAVTLTAAFAAGAAGEYFLDPQNGRRRRHQARDRGLALIRRPAQRAADTVRRRASYAEGVAEGALHEMAGAPGRDPDRLNDAALAAKVQSEVFRDEDSPKDRVSVSAHNGTIELRGELDAEDEIEALLERVAEVEGVSSVENLLHLPGEPAPTRA
jgi:osmotically-inducible protein OsmY